MRFWTTDDNKKVALIIVLACAVLGACISEILVAFFGMEIIKGMLAGMLGAYAGLSVFGLTGGLLMMVLVE